MNKTFKTVMMLGTVCVLAACGGKKWTKTDFAGAKEAVADYESHVDELFDYENLKMSLTQKQSSVENIAGVSEDVEEVEAVFEVDVPNFKIHVKTYEKTSYVDYVDPEESEEEVALADVYYYFDAKKGFVEMIDDGEQKVYAIMLTVAALDAAAEAKELTRKEYLTAVFADGAAEFFDAEDAFVAHNVVSKSTSIENLFGPEAGATYDSKLYVAGEGNMKLEATQKFTYDDECEHGYAVDATSVAKIHVEDWLLKSLVSGYHEVGKYYVTETEKVDYKYDHESETTYRKNAKFSVPSLKGYTEVVAD